MAICKFCGGKFPSKTSAGSHTHKRYCNEKCRKNAWYRHRMQRPPLMKNCVVCGESFDCAYERARKTCGAECGEIYAGRCDKILEPNINHVDQDAKYVRAMKAAGYEQMLPVRDDSPILSKPLAIFAPREVRQRAGFINPKDE